MHPGTPIRLVLAYPEVKEIPTIPSQFQELAERLEKLPLDQLANETLKTLQSINQKVNSPEITEAIKDLSSTLRETRTLMQNVNGQVTSMASNLENTLETARDALGEAKEMFAQGRKTLAFEEGATGRLVDRAEETLVSAKGAMEEARETFKKAGDAATLAGSGVESTSRGARAALKDARKLVRNVDGQVKTLVTGVQKALRSVRVALQQAEQTMLNVGSILDERSPLRADLAETLSELSAAARSVRAFAEYLERNPGALLRGKGSPGGR
jgi:paraquat-inducible protein B